jgi:hypothetical protein
MSITVERSAGTTPYLQTVRDLDRAHQRIKELEEVLDNIARRSIMDSVTAISMRAIASSVLPRRRRQ